MKKKNTWIIVIGTLLFIWSTSPLHTEEQPGFLKGKIHTLDAKNISLENKFASAEKEFKKSKEGNTFFTGYAFISRHSMDMCGDYSSTQPFRVTSKNNRIKLDTTRHKKSGVHYSSEEGSEPVGALFLHSISNGKTEIIDIHLIDLDRTFEFPEEPLYWLGDIETEESLQFLEGKFEASSLKLQKKLIFIIAEHQSPKTYDFLRGVSLGNYEREVRKNSIFWLGTYKDSKSLTCLKEIYNKEKNRELKKQIVFALNLSDQKEAIEELISIAKTDHDSKVRKNAIFWLGQKASKESVEALKEVVEGKDDIEVKESAVFAISQLPEEKSVPLLIEIAKSNQSPSVRKKAVFWLGQTGSKEALKFFEEILLKK
jgi:HEAT repeat protein